MSACRHSGHQQLPYSCGRYLHLDLAHAVHPVLQEAELAEHDRLHEQHGCDCHHDCLACCRSLPPSYAYTGGPILLRSSMGMSTPKASWVHAALSFAITKRSSIHAGCKLAVSMTARNTDQICSLMTACHNGLTCSLSCICSCEPSGESLAVGADACACNSRRLTI